MIDTAPPPGCCMDDVVDPETHFLTPQQGWYRIWFKTKTAKGWCAQGTVASVVLKTYRMLVAGGMLKNFLIEKLPLGMTRYCAASKGRRMTYSACERRYLTRKGF